MPAGRGEIIQSAYHQLLPDVTQNGHVSLSGFLVVPD